MPDSGICVMMLFPLVAIALGGGVWSFTVSTQCQADFNRELGRAPQ